MANSKLIVVEGPQGVGKTTITDFLRNSLPCTNLYRLSGTKDISQSGKKKAYDMYVNLIDYIKKLENCSINLLFDRTFFTEENYCRLGKKEYIFTDVYEKLLYDFSNLDFEIYYVTLYLENTNLYEERLKRDGKAVFEASRYSKDNSVEQQNMYLKMADEIKEKYKNINVINIANDKPLEEVKQFLRKELKF